MDFQMSWLDTIDALNKIVEENFLLPLTKQRNFNSSNVSLKIMK